jgi:hypothetical protein
MRTISPVCLSFLFSLSILDGCGGTLGGNPEVEGSNPASSYALSFSITDAPVDDAKHVFITVESLSLLNSEGAWLNIPLETTTEIDLLHYQDGLTSPLAGISEIAAGTYSQTRLVLSESAPARLIDLNGVEHSLKVPSGSESGLKINSPITIDSTLAKAMVIDFDLRKSVKLAGNANSQNAKYILKPVLRMVDKAATGSLEGPVAEGEILCLYPKGSVKDSSDDCDNATASGKVKNSLINISFIPSGKYDLRVFKNGLPLKDQSDVKIDANAVTVVSGL